MKIPSDMLEHLKAMATAIPLEKDFQWKLPPNTPVAIPAGIIGAFSQNVYLKENLASALEKDSDFAVHYWVIRDWGGIATFQIGDRNNARIKKFKEEILKGQLSQNSFDAISSLSKLSSFWEPERYAIYDSRAVFSLNWIIFRYSHDRQLFPQPSGRNTEISKYDIDTLFKCSGISHQYRCKKTAYHEYCSLLQDLSEQLYKSRKPFLRRCFCF